MSGGGHRDEHRPASMGKAADQSRGLDAGDDREQGGAESAEPEQLAIGLGRGHGCSGGAGQVAATRAN